MSIIIGGDTVPTKTNQQLFNNGDAYELCGTGILDAFNEADYRILNLEVPLCADSSPIKKCGPCLIADPSSTEALKALKVDLLTLANNHIMDQGRNGLISTTAALDKAGISYVGVGENPEKASQPFFFTTNGKKFGVYACAEHEFSIAEGNKPGANPFDPLDTPDHVIQTKAQCDYLIVLYHGGKEHYRYPSPYLQKTCRKLVEKGADLVVCQHSHCVGCKEEYKNGTIVYGQGNFLFDGQDNEYWNTGLLIRIDNMQQTEYIPIEKNGCRTRLATGRTKEEILKGFFTRSEEINNPETINDRYLSFAEENYTNYVMHFSGCEGSLAFRAADKLFNHRLKEKHIKRYTDRYGPAVLNFVECEAHRELLLKALKIKIQDDI